MTLRDLTFRTSATSEHAFERARQETAALNGIACLHDKKIDEWSSFTREVFTRLYRPTDEKRTLEPDEVSPWASKSHRAVETQGDWPELRMMSQSHRAVAAQAAATIAMKLGEAIGLDKMSADPVKSQDQRALQRQRAALERAGETDAAGELGAASAKAANRRHTLERAFTDEGATITHEAISAAVKAATFEARQMSEVVGLMRGWGLGEDESGGSEGEVPTELLQLVMRNRRLQDILRMLGRMRESFAAKGLAKESRGHENLVGIETGDDPMRLVPQEIARLGHPVLAGELFARMLDKGATVWKVRGYKKKNQGDLIILVDRSGSMAEERIVWARAVAAAAMLQATGDGRHVSLALFSDTVDRVEIRPRDKADLANALRFLSSDVRGGTRAERALLNATTGKQIGNGNADILMITDGEFPSPGAVINTAKDTYAAESSEARIQVDRWRKEGGRVVLVGIECTVERHEGWTDERHDIHALTADAGGAVLEGLLAGGSR